MNLVVAMDKNLGIGREGRLPWELPLDMRFFRELTTCPDRLAVENRYGFGPENSGNPVAAAEFTARLKSNSPLVMPSPDRRNAVLMGRHTWESLPAAYQPLPNRLNGVLSRNGTHAGGGTHRVWPSMDAALADLHADQTVAEVFVIGGSQIYAEAVSRPDCARIYLTQIDAVFPCDVFFSALASRL